MRYTIPGVTGALILTKDESGYQEVLDSIAAASAVTVVTNNISENQDQLFSALRSSDAEIRIITTIPARMNFCAGTESWFPPTL